MKTRSPATINRIGVDMRELLTLASGLAERAGELVHRKRADFLSEPALATKSSPTDLVTEADRAAERLIVEGILAERPGDAILGEEGGQQGRGDTGVRWVIDPIDGTVNYVYGQPHYAVSIAAEIEGRSVVGVVLNPATGERWTAIAGEGAWRNGRRLRCSGQDRLAEALVATGFSYVSEKRAKQGAVVAALLPEIRDIRRGGSCALDLCYVAEGRVDAYYEQGVQRWDAAAGGLIATEAGAKLSGLAGRDWSPNMVLAAGPGLHGHLDKILTELGADQ